MSEETPQIFGLTSEQSSQAQYALDYVAEKSKAEGIKEGIKLGRQQVTGEFIMRLPEAKHNPRLAQKLADDPNMSLDDAKEYLVMSRENQLKRAIRAI